MNKRERLIPQREINWKKYAYLHNRENNIFYDCECGKRYVSFPAIYLHFQRKHGRKLSTIQQPPECQIRKNQKQLVYYYFIRVKRSFLPYNPQQKAQQTSIQTVKKGVFNQLFQQFIREDKKQLKKVLELPEIRKIFFDLASFVKSRKNYEQEIESFKIQTVPTLPLYLNDFAINKLQQESFKNMDQYALFCYVLLLFSNWMNIKGYTSLTVEMNASQEKTVLF